MNRIFEWMAPEESRESVWPLTLLIRFWPVFSLVLLALNDHVFKGSGILPALVTGKLSDFAGLFFFPLLLVTLYNLVGCVLFGFRFRVGILISPSASSAQLLFFCFASALFFSLVQLYAPVSEFYAKASAILLLSPGSRVVVTQDPTDIVAVISVVAAYFFGMRAIALCPPYRLALISFSLREVADEKTRRSFATNALADVRRLSKNKKGLDALVQAIALDENPKIIEEALREYRGRTL